MRMLNNLEGISHDIQLYLKITIIVVSVPIAANDGFIIIDSFAPQMKKRVIIMEKLAILLKNVESRNEYRDKHLKLSNKCQPNRQDS